MNKGLAAQIKNIFGHVTHRLINLKPRVGKLIIPNKRKTEQFIIS